ncbi:response regulator [Paenibacillus athensensis]|uniref:AraC family transcriptional regulator n=1 Tax=Paenibacillus athensensis TaxID=1967502 RepID=A0A4Y8PR06_9BACL|nr:response regulator [Paenibacillus athensensis]MCD1261174.1 response regulator [Paenibacillus athensensis]
MRQLMIIDDNSVLADDLAHMLPWSTLGIEAVHTAYSAQEALELLSLHSIDVVVTDIRMPGMSGLELIGEIRKSGKRTRCILLSGYADFEYAQMAVQLQSSDYLLKPVADEDLLAAVQRALDDLDREWREISSFQRALYSLREQLPKLREYLLLDLLTGKQPLHAAQLNQKLSMYEVPLCDNDPFSMLLLRVDHAETPANGSENEVLLDYALANITAEIFGDVFDIWHCKDSHGLTVCLLHAKMPGASPAELNDWVEQRSIQLQHTVKAYLKTGISMLVSKSGRFPDDLLPLYQSSIANFRHFIGSDTELFVSLTKEPSRPQMTPLQELYRQPTLATLLEIGQWADVETKVADIFRELADPQYHSPDHVLEAYFQIAAALTALSQKNKLSLFDMYGDEFYTFGPGRLGASLDELREWTGRMLERCKKAIHVEEQDSRTSIIKQVQDYIQANLDTATLHTISAHVFLNPSYLSKIYKTETGEGIGDYMFRMRMDKGAEWLTQTNEKIYDIAARLGYQKPSYFIQIFKKHFGVTPQEYRNRV